MSADPLHLLHDIRAPRLTWAGKVVNGYLADAVGMPMIPNQRGIGGKTRAALDTLKNKFVLFS